MAFAFMNIEKIKSYGTLTSKYNHNCRKVEVMNADPDKADQNETLVALGTRDGEELSYAEAFQERLGSLPYYQEHKIRPDQVLGYEVLLTFSKDESINLDMWKQQSLQWLHDTFDVAADGKSNVLNVEFHGDETGNVHIHAFVVPIDERGHLNAKRFTNGSRTMTDLQSSYADYMSCLGLKRGLEGSSARHQQIRKMYADLNNVTRISEVKPGETASQYRERILDDCETMYAARKKAGDDYARAVRRDADEYKILAKEAMSDEMERTKRSVNKQLASTKAELSSAQHDLEETQEQYESYQEQMRELITQMFEIRSQYELDKEEAARAARYKEIMDGLQVIEAEDPVYAARVREDMDTAASRADELEMVRAGREEIDMEN